MADLGQSETSAEDRLDDAIIVIHKLREALAFMRCCEASGERGADHPVVLRSIDRAQRWMRGERLGPEPEEAPYG